jgi:hypothetical protein
MVVVAIGWLVAVVVFCVVAVGGEYGKRCGDRCH